jgi:hypothetical protein
MRAIGEDSGCLSSTPDNETATRSESADRGYAECARADVGSYCNFPIAAARCPEPEVRTEARSSKSEKTYHRSGLPHRGMERVETVIIGDGPAGSSAALVLGRCRRRVVVLDSEQYRNARASLVRGFLTRDGTLPRRAPRARARRDRAIPHRRDRE